MSMMSVYLTNLGRYVEGSLIGEWVNLPVGDDELKKVFQRIGINKRYEEWFITDYDVDICNMSNVVGEYSSLKALNKLAVKLDELDYWEKEKLRAVIEAESPSDIATIIEMIENLDDWDLLIAIYNEEDLGFYYAEECCCIDIPENLKSYFDYAAFGRDVHLEGTGAFTESGYLISNK